MSNYHCDKCGKEIVDTKFGYITECEHHPLEMPKREALWYRFKYLEEDIADLKAIIQNPVKLSKLQPIVEWKVTANRVSSVLKELIEDVYQYLTKQFREQKNKRKEEERE